MGKILIVEDDLKSRHLLVKIVESLNHTVIQSQNGRHAYETLCLNPDVELVITDVMMPEVDGRDLVRLIRGNEAVAKLPILIISAVIGVSEILDLLKLGATAFLPKPVDFANIKEFLDKYID